MAMYAWAFLLVLSITAFVLGICQLTQGCADWIPNHRPDPVDDSGWTASMMAEYDFEAIVISLFGLSLVAPMASWLLYIASTRYLWRVAIYAAVVTVEICMRLRKDVLFCRARSPTEEHSQRHRLHFTEPLFIVAMVTFLWFQKLIVDCLVELEGSALRNLGTSVLRKLTYATSTSIVLAVIMGFFRLKGFCDILIWIALLSIIGFVALAAFTFVFAWRLTQYGAERALEDRAQEAREAATILRLQAVVILASLVFRFLRMILISIVYDALWPIPSVRHLGLDTPTGFLLIENAPICADAILNCLTALSLSGAFSGALRAGLEASVADRGRRIRWLNSSASLEPEDDSRWQGKVEELAGRGFSVDALLGFYALLGDTCMKHFDGDRSTTTDVVRHAIIPLSRQRQCAYSEVMMCGKRIQPDCMVTHNWSNRFRDLVAAILADALDEVEYDRVSLLLKVGFEQLRAWVAAKGVGARSYWVCAFCVNQHAGICGTNPFRTLDTVTGAEHPICTCGFEKAWNDTPPTLEDARGIPCEMNKFDDMMKYLSASNSNFAQVIAVDASFMLFSRAWCVAEIAAAHKMGMLQRMKVVSVASLNEHEPRLRVLRIEDMEATRKEDRDEILAKIPDTAAFDRHLQMLLFSDLLPAWRRMDVARKLGRVGHVIRWKQVAALQGTRDAASDTDTGTVNLYIPR